MASYGDDEELRYIESNAIRAAVDAWSKSEPGEEKWTKTRVGKHITIGGMVRNRRVPRLLSIRILLWVRSKT